MNIRYLSLALASVLALSGCGSDSNDNNNNVSLPSAPVLPTPGLPKPDRPQNQVFGFAFDGKSDLRNIHDTNNVVQRLVVDDSGEYWMIYNNTIDLQGNQLDPLPDKVSYGLMHGTFSENTVNYSYNSKVTDFSVLNRTRRVFDFSVETVANNALSLIYIIDFGDTLAVNTNSVLARTTLPEKQKISEQVGQSTGALAGTFGVSSGTFTVNKGGTFNIIDTRQCIIRGTLKNNNNSKFTVVDAIIDASSQRCPLEDGVASGIRLIDDEGGTILLTTPNDNNGYIFNYA